MDVQAATTKMKTLFGKARAARLEGKKEQAKAFRAGAQRAQRNIRQAAIKARATAKKETTEE